MKLLPARRAKGAGNAQAPAADSTFVVFSVDGTRYAFSVDTVLRTLQFPAVTRLPAAGPTVLGVFQHAGRILTLFDLRARFGAGNEPPADPWVVVALVDGVARGLLVDAVHDVLTLPGALIVPGPPVPPSVPKEAVRGILRAPHGKDEDDPAAAGRGGVAAPPGGPLDQAEAERRQRAASRASLKVLHPVNVLDLAALFPSGGRG